MNETKLIGSVKDKQNVPDEARLFLQRHKAGIATSQEIVVNFDFNVNYPDTMRGALDCLRKYVDAYEAIRACEE